MNNLAIWISLILVLYGCATNPRIEQLTSSQRAAVSMVKVYRNNPYQKFKNIGVVSGLSCHRNKYQQQDVSESEAIEGLKIQAVLLNANVVVNSTCQKNSDTDWTNNCWASVKCIGDAIQLE